MTDTEVEHRVTGIDDQNSESLLISGCINCIAQCDQLLNVISQQDYIASTQGGASIGVHIRHLLDRFHSFFAGLPKAAIDYDERKRDKEIENNPDAAAFALASVLRRIEQLHRQSFADQQITVKEAVLCSSPGLETSSTVEREMLGLITHSIHHLAIIALLAKPFGYHVDSNFGKSPSNIAFERS
jgi:hypothetical protein